MNACEVRQLLQLVALLFRVPAATARARCGCTSLQVSGGAYSDVRLLMLPTHAGSSLRALLDTSLQCGRAARIGFRMQRASESRADRLEIVRLQIESGSFVRLQRSMNLCRTVARRGKVHAARSDAQVLQAPELADPLGQRLECGRIRPPARRRSG